MRSGRMRNASRTRSARRRPRRRPRRSRALHEPHHVRMVGFDLSRLLDDHDALARVDEAESRLASRVVLPLPVAPVIRARRARRTSPAADPAPRRRAMSDATRSSSVERVTATRAERDERAAVHDRRKHRVQPRARAAGRPRRRRVVEPPAGRARRAAPRAARTSSGRRERQRPRARARARDPSRPRRGR